MKRLYTLYRLYRWYKNPTRLTNSSRIVMDTVLTIKRTNKAFKKLKKGSHERNLLAGIVNNCRKANPYKSIDFSEGAKMYVEYMDMENTLGSFQDFKNTLSTTPDMYVTCFRGEFVYRGERPYEFYTASNYFKSLMVYRIDLQGVDDIKTSQFFDLSDAENSFHLSEDISEGNHTMYRYSTEKEIEQFKVNEVACRHLIAKVEAHVTEVGKIETEILRLCRNYES